MLLKVLYLVLHPFGIETRVTLKYDGCHRKTTHFMHLGIKHYLNVVLGYPHIVYIRQTSKRMGFIPEQISVTSVAI